MKDIKIIVDGKEIQAQVSEEQLKQLCEKKRTGYERVEIYSQYFSSRYSYITDTRTVIDNILFEMADYYSDNTVYENNYRADTLMRQLRRFAVENRKRNIDWNSISNKKWYIYYSYGENKICADFMGHRRDFGNIYFDSQETVQKAIDQFKVELLWYFTEYKDSL